MARVLSSPVSKPLIGYYIRRYHIELSGFQKADSYRSFNDFFTRKRRDDAIRLDRTATHLVSPCDGLLTVYPITSNSKFSVKGCQYSVAALLDDPDLAERFDGGTCLIFRLTPRHYHRYCYIDSGRELLRREIPGVLHSVRPICCESTPVYVQNSRAYALLETQQFGTMVQMEVGALLVGKIVNHPASNSIERGQEKGWFEFGGSTIILLLQKNAAVIAPDILAFSRRGKEYPVTMGQKIGAANEI